jgi:ribosomal-protein-alanine N-acetyltransferase
MLRYFLTIAVLLISFQNVTYAMHKLLEPGDVDLKALTAERERVFKNFDKIETERLIIRKFKPEDFTALVEIMTDPEVTLYESRAKNPTPKEIKKELIEKLRHYEKGEPTFYAVEYKENGKVIGSCGFGLWPLIFCRTSIGCFINRAYWGKEIAPEAARAGIDFAFGTGLVNRVEARCNSKNRQSWRAMEKAGLQYEGTFKEFLRNKNGFFDAKQYYLTLSEWQKNKNNKE